jgi:hypothetical protein
VETFVQLLVRDAPFGVRILQAPHGRISVVFADHPRQIFW